MARGGMLPQGMAGDAPTGVGADLEPSSEGVESGNATPEEQAAYELFVSNISNLISDKATLAKIVERLRTGDNPIEALARTAVMLVTRVEDSALEKTGADEIDPDILLNAGRETVEVLADISAKAQVHEFSQDELEAAYLHATDLYRSERMQQGKLNPADYQQSMQAVKEADAAGTIDQDYPELAEYAQHVQSRAKVIGEKAGDAVEEKIAPGDEESAYERMA